MNGEVGLDALYYRARAKIFWGEPADAVRQMLMEEGMEWSEIKGVVQELLDERADEIRELGKGELLVGAGMFFGSLLLMALIVGVGVIPLKTTGLVGLVSVYGLYKLAKGQRYLFGARKVTGSVQDL